MCIPLDCVPVAQVDPKHHWKTNRDKGRYLTPLCHSKVLFITWYTGVTEHYFLFKLMTLSKTKKLHLSFEMSFVQRLRIPLKIRIEKAFRWSATTNSPCYSTRSMKHHGNATRNTQELQRITFFLLNLWCLANLKNFASHNSYMIHNYFLKF